MSTRVWQGDAAPVAQVSRATPANVEIGDIFTLIVNNKSLSFTATAGTVANVTAGLLALWNASVIPEFAEITAVDQTTYLELTCDTPGVPFTVTSSTTDGGGNNNQTLGITTPTAATGPNFWSDAQNWSGTTVPVNSDTVIIDSGSVDILYGLDQSAVTLTAMIVTAAYQGTIGLPRSNPAGYEEYRDTYLRIGSTALTIGGGAGTGSGRVKIDTGTAQTALHVISGGVALDTGYQATAWKGTHASNTVLGEGALDIAMLGGEVATVATLRQARGSVRCGAGLTLTTVNKSGGIIELNCSATTVTQTGQGIVNVLSGAFTTIELRSGNADYNGPGTITNLIVAAGARANFFGSNQARTVTNASIYAGGTIADPNRTVIWTNGIDLQQCSLGDVVLGLGRHITLTPSDI